ncbi:MAG: hypothetical protein K2K00_03735 [Muribaculaceae bacterium]|nr:hypothetical protein [Muribaculaceae bacterium]
MKLLLQRIFAGKDYTIGRLSVDGMRFSDTLELPIALTDGRTNVPQKTAIPPGVYEIVVNVSPKFKRLLPRLLNVPGRDGILIHRGNTPSDISGCILPGENKVKGKVLNSTPYEQRLVEMTLEAQSRCEDITIEVINP